jgi:twitching motility protein PilJ
MALNIPGLKSAAQPDGGSASSNSAEAPGLLRGRLPVIGHLPLAQQVRVLGAVFLLFIAIAAALVYQDLRGTRHNASHIYAVGQLRTLAQSIARAAPQALAGESAGFADLAASRSGFASLLERLAKGGDIDGVTLPAASGRAQERVLQLDAAWSVHDRNASLLLAQQPTLTALSGAARAVNEAGPVLMSATGRIAAQRGARDGGLSLSFAGLLTQVQAATLALASNPLASNDEINILMRAVPALLDAAAQLEQGAEGEARDTFARARAMLAPALSALLQALDKPAEFASARTAGQLLSKGVTALAGPVDELGALYAAQRDGRIGGALAAVLCVLLALASVFMMVRAYNEDQHVQRIQVEGSREDAKREKDTTQQAILRLMNEMGDLADGDLTVRATVSEDITGAIADSVNYTIEELSVLVKRINDAAGAWPKHPNPRSASPPSC